MIMDPNPERVDHDQRFKTLIVELFEMFYELYSPVCQIRLAANRCTWLQQEVYPVPPEGSAHILDLVGQAPCLDPIPGHEPTSSGDWLIVIHVEIEAADRSTTIQNTMPSRYFFLWEKYGLPILPLVLFLNVGLAGIGIREIRHRLTGNVEPMVSRYFFPGLPALGRLRFGSGDSLPGMSL